MTSTIGIPIKLLNEAQNHVVTLEITSGQVYRGKLIEAEDNMNVQLKDITVTARDGRVSHLDQVYIRGSHVRFFIVPDMLRNAPMFRSRGVRGRGVGMARGRATVNRARGQRGTELRLATPYYTATIPIWHDTISPSQDLLQEWSTEWLSSEAAEVVQSIGAWVVSVRKPLQQHPKDGEGGVSPNQIRRTLKTIHEVLTTHQEKSNKYASLDNEPILLLLGMPQPLRPLLEISNDEWEDLCQACGGWEWIDGEARGKNEFGENVGLERLKEALEANEWDGGTDDTQIDDNLEDELGLGDGKLRDGEQELETDGVGMHDAILMQDTNDDAGSEGDVQIQELESMMLKMQAIKAPNPAERGATLPDGERRKLAAKAVKEVMQSM
ncbi:MAG: hypothetical protein Q9203_000198 [Teloschistes exilis]